MLRFDWEYRFEFPFRSFRRFLPIIFHYPFLYTPPLISDLDVALFQLNASERTILPPFPLSRGRRWKVFYGGGSLILFVNRASNPSHGVIRKAPPGQEKMLLWFPSRFQDDPLPDPSASTKHAVNSHPRFSK